jgi:hypothetical protein
MDQGSGFQFPFGWRIQEHGQDQVDPDGKQGIAPPLLGSAHCRMDMVSLILPEKLHLLIQ